MHMLHIKVRTQKLYRQKSPKAYTANRQHFAMLENKRIQVEFSFLWYSQKNNKSYNMLACMLSRNLMTTRSAIYTSV